MLGVPGRTGHPKRMLNNFDFMKKASKWSAAHPNPARILIVMAHVLLAMGGIELGLFLFANDVRLPDGYGYLPLAIYLIAYVAYPYRQGRQGQYNCSYTHRKALDGVLMGSLFCLWLTAGMELPERLRTVPSNASVRTAELPIAQGMLRATQQDASKAGRKIQRYGKQAVEQLAYRVQKRLEQFKGRSGWAVFGIIVLGIVLSMALIVLTMALSCNLSCSGNEVAAVLVLILGIGAVVALWVPFTKWIRRVRAKE